MESNPQRSVFSYTCCTDLYSFPKSDALQLQWAVCTQAVPNCEILLLLVHQLYDHYTTQSCSLGRGEQSAINRIFVHLLYESVQFPKVGLRTVLSGCVYTKGSKLRGPIATCTRGIRLLECFRMFTKPWQTISSEWHFRTPGVRICTSV